MPERNGYNAGERNDAMDGQFDPQALIDAKAAARLADERELDSGVASAREINDRNSWAHGLDLANAKVRVRHEME